jgi:hypothetical protein
MSQKLAALALFIFLAGCQKTDVQNCVDANLEAFDQGKSDIADETEDRASFKARAYLFCGQTMAGRNNP